MRFLGTGGPHEGSLSRWRLVCRDDNLHSEGSPCPLLGALPLADRGPAWTVGVRGRADPSLRHCSCIFVLACFLSAPQAARSLTSPSPGAGNSHIPDRVLCPRLKRGRGRLSSLGSPRVARVFPGHRGSRHGALWARLSGPVLFHPQRQCRRCLCGCQAPNPGPTEGGVCVRGVGPGSGNGRRRGKWRYV